MTIQQALDFAEPKLKQAGIQSFRLDAELLLCNVLAKSREFLIANRERKLTTSETQLYKKYISRRTDREPLCYITNDIEFCGHNFFVDKRVLAPRVETETIVENVIKYAPSNSRLIDIGTGSGSIAISIAISRPDLEIIATEISTDAIEVAKINAKKLGVKNKIKFIHSDLFSNVNGKYNTVVTNLPYVSSDYTNSMKPEVKKEPSIALYGGSGDGLDLYRKFYQQLPQYLNSKARVYHESDPWQHKVLIDLAHSVGLETMLEDYFILGFSAH